ncbi:MAG: hypothetical protein L3K11_03635 [Thermoplasmata archaeon]|nr:hypothetical protein [Thermoplasmata archaeon]
MLLAPLAGASPIYNFSAPYTHMTTSNSNSLYSSGCKDSATEPVAPSFSTSTGRFLFAADTSAGSCAGAYFNDASASGGVVLTGPSFLISTGGAHKVSALWKVSYTASVGAVLHAATGNNSYSYVYADASIYAYLYLVDAHTGAYVFGTGPTYATIADWYAASTTSITVSVGPTIHALTEWAKLTAGHTYETVLYIYEYASAYSYAYGTSSAHNSAWADLNAGSGGNGATLVRISVF